MSTLRKSAVLAALWLLASAVQGLAQTYTVTDLGTLSGNSVSKATALNNAGEATGTSTSPTAAISVTFSGGNVINIDTLGANVSVANAINGLGEVAGWNSFDSASFDPQAFSYSNGSMTNINSPAFFHPALRPTGSTTREKLSAPAISPAPVFMRFFIAAAN